MKMKDLSIEFCGVKCENPFFLSSSPVGNNYEMCAKALEAGWGGIVFKTVGVFIPNEVSPRFCDMGKESTSFRTPLLPLTNSKSFSSGKFIKWLILLVTIEFLL
jgi:hypothetical protein